MSNTQPKPDGEDSTSEPDFSVVDPDAYNRGQRLKEIHQSRQRVTKHLAEMDLNTHPNDASSYNAEAGTRLGYLVATYILELEPLLQRAEMDIDDYGPDDKQSLFKFAMNLGHDPEKWKKPPSPHTSMRYFQSANNVYADLGMELDLTDDSDSWEV